MMERAKTWLVLAVAIEACGGGGAPDPQNFPDVRLGDCQSGNVRGCNCADGREGIQLCEHGEWPPCSCVGPSTCSASNPTGACASGQTCVGGTCCAADQVCGSVCCGAAQACVRDQNGVASCAARCSTNSDCPGRVGDRCCRVLTDPVTGAPLSYGACAPFVAGQTLCRCEAASDCGTGACTPMQSASGVPMRPYICTRPACAPYAQCPAVGNCGVGYCNLCDVMGNCFCARTCTS